MRTIKIDGTQLSSTARALDGLAERVHQAGANLDTALRAARAVPFPEKGGIEALYAGLRSRISQSEADLGIYRRDLVSYLGKADAAERLAMALLAKARTPYAEAGVKRPGMKGVSVDGRAIGQELSIFALGELLTRRGDALDVAGDILAGGDWHFLNGALGIATLGLGVIAIQNSRGYDRAVNITTTTVGTGSTVLTLVEKLGPAGSRLTGFAGAAASRLGVIGLGISIGTPIGNGLRTWGEGVEAAGGNKYAEAVKPLQTAGLPGGKPRPVAAVETSLKLTTAVVMDGSAELGQQVFNRWYGVEDAKPADEINNHQATTLLAGFRQQHPNASIVRGDGVFTIRIPSRDGLPQHSYTFDNKTGKLVR